MHRGAGPAAGLEAHADFNRFHRGDGHEGARQPAVEFAVPVHVAPKAGWEPAHHDLAFAAEGVAIILGLVDSLR